MESRVVILIMALATFIAYPFLSGDDRKYVAPLATSMDDSDDPEEMDDDEAPVSMEDDEEEMLSDQQLQKERQKMKESAADTQLQ